MLLLSRILKYEWKAEEEWRQTCQVQSKLYWKDYRFALTFLDEPKQPHAWADTFNLEVKPENVCP